MADGTEGEKDRLNRFRDSFAKEVAERQKVMASLTAMASALIALPILFFKDIFKESVRAGDTLIALVMKQHFIVSGAAYCAWTTLIFSIFFTLMFTMQAGKFIHNLYKFDYPPDYLDDSKTGEKDRVALGKTFDLAVYTFLIGFSLMMFFVLNYAKITMDMPK